MSHANNIRAFSRRYGRGFWSRARKFSESAKPAPATSLLAGTTGADSGFDSKVGTDRQGDARCSDESTKGAVARCVGSADAPHVAPPNGGETDGATPPTTKGGDNGGSLTNYPDLSPSPTYSAGGGVLSVMPLLAQFHADRWATLAVIAIFICAFAVSAYRANQKR